MFFLSELAQSETQIASAQLDGAVEYTDCISAEGLDHTQRVSW